MATDGARSHGVGGWSLLRSLAVAGVGAVHALLVSLIGLVAVAPAFVSGGKALAGVWRHPGYGHAGMVLLLSTAWCLAVGVFSQILWDDRPITAALAHLSWRSGR
ncbi:MAG TPA: hypothetical protein VK586_21765 [Streptosporangiaceae bacterium]|nr:hypothetical protein [Streptosporangiaceae bacterium]